MASKRLPYNNDNISPILYHGSNVLSGFCGFSDDVHTPQLATLVKVCHEGFRRKVLLLADFIPILYPLNNPVYVVLAVQNSKCFGFGHLNQWGR